MNIDCTSAINLSGRNKYTVHCSGQDFQIDLLVWVGVCVFVLIHWCVACLYVRACVGVNVRVRLKLARGTNLNLVSRRRKLVPLVLCLHQRLLEAAVAPNAS